MNEIIWCTMITVVITQASKIPIHYFTSGKLDWKIGLSTGSMPSSHTAAVAATSMGIGFVEGFNSAIYALSFVYAAMVMHDAIKVRGESGKQAQVINIIIRDLENLQATIGKKDFVLSEKKLKEMLGHTYTEVFAGLIIGVLISMIMF